MQTIRLLFFFCFMAAFSKGQLVLNVPDSKTNVSFSNFKIIGVIDSLKNAPRNSLLKNKNGEKISLKLKLQVDNYFQQLVVDNFKFTNEKDSILLIISYLGVEEVVKKELIEGEVTIKYSFYKLFKSDTLFLTSSTAKSVYKRNYSTLNSQNFEHILFKATSYNFSFLEDWIHKNKDYHPAFVLSSRVEILSFYAQNDEDTIYHDSRKISWDDFRAKPTEISKFDAAIFANIAFESEFTISNRVLLAKITPKVYMVRGMSWVRNTNQSRYSLAHEQLHFDIAKVAMLHFLERIKLLRETTPDDLISRIQYEYLEAYREMNRLQDAYDEDTRHGLDVAEQANWQYKVEDWLTLKK